MCNGSFIFNKIWTKETRRKGYIKGTLMQIWKSPYMF